MKAKSLGQIAHDFWWCCSSDKRWEDLSPFEQDEWDQMANAVAREVRKRMRKNKL